MSAHAWRPQRGEVVLVRFPFVEAGGRVQAKPRPAVVVSGQIIHQRTADVLIVAVSSRPASQSLPTDYQIHHGTAEAKAAGLKRSSWVNVSNLATVPKAAIARRLGHLTQEGLQAVDDRLRLALGLQ